MKHYEEVIKQEAVQMFLEGHHTYAMIAEQLGIRKAARIKIWVRMYRKEGELSFYKPIGRPLKAEAEPRELERLRMENALLKKFHTELRGLQLAQRNIGRSTTTEANTR
jgi:transposase-like protein